MLLWSTVVPESKCPHVNTQYNKRDVNNGTRWPLNGYVWTSDGQCLWLTMALNVFEKNGIHNKQPTQAHSSDSDNNNNNNNSFV